MQTRLQPQFSFAGSFCEANGASHGVYNMKTFLAAAALSTMVATSFAIPIAPAEAGSQYREWRGRDGRTYCRKSDGTVGLVVGGAAGALVGRAVDTRGERATGTILGAAAGALLGREVARKRKCR
jgi:Glycine zipper 2TM domain